VPGVEVRVRGGLAAIRVHVRVQPGAQIASPVHLCFGLTRPRGAQRVLLDVDIGEGATVRFLAHCLFAHARHASHRMHARMRIRRDAQLSIEEGHVHSATGGILVTPRARISVGPGARLFSDFSLLMGRVGRLRSDYRIDVAAGGLAELSVRVRGRADDRIDLNDHISLNGAGARGMVKTRVALTERARAVVRSTTEGNAADARGHMDCTEIVKDQAQGESVPVVRVSHPLAQVTHEAAIGTVDQTQLETLMAHGLTPDEAVELVISGLLRPAPADLG
jgi:Fe-S cluster assembly scaffold protein SufB